VQLRGLEQDLRLDPVARAVRLLSDEAAIDRVLDRRDDELEAELVDPADRATIRIAAISAAAAEAAGEGWQALRIASSPNDAELLALAARLCET